MHNTEVEKRQLPTFLGIFTLILMAVFAAEVTVMQLYSDLFASLAVVQRAFLDASTLILIIALPLWFFVFSPAFRVKIQADGGYASLAVALYSKVLAGIYLIQLLIMLVLPEIMTYFPQPLESLVDGGLTVLFSAPLFWWLLYRLELRYRLEPLADFLNAPITLYILLLFMIFLADMLQEILFHQLNIEMTEIQFQLFDALVSIVMIAPLLLILVVRPLSRLAQSEKARTDAVYDQVIDAIVKVNREGTIQAFNLAAQNIFGIRAVEVIDKPASLLLDRGQIELAVVLDELGSDEEGSPLNFHELTARGKNGDLVTLDLSISKISLEGPDEFLLLLRDISDRKAAEEALLATDAIFREIFNQTEDAILFIKPCSGEILDVNTTTESLYGFSKRELQEHGAKVFCSENEFSQFTGLIDEINELGSSEIECFANYRKDGRQIVVSIRGKMMTLKGAQVIYCTVRDISKRVQLENEAREIQAKLIHTNKMTSLGLLVSGVAHEINNPNNFVLSNAQLLSKVWKDTQIVLQQYYNENGDFVLGGIPFSELEDHVPGLFSGIADGSQRINAIVNNLKRFVRQDSNLITTGLDINKVVSAAVSMLHHELVKHTDNFHIDLADDLPLIKGSSQQLGQVIINLLMNACQALPDKSCAVWVKTSFDPLEQIIKISIRDQGSGLPEELKDKIIEPFFTTKLDSGGTGLGLSISQSIIKDHGGQIDYFSQPAKGTTFTVTLPVVGSNDQGVDA